MDLDDVRNLASDEDDPLKEGSGVPDEPVQPTNVKTVPRSLKTEGFDWNGGPEDNDDEAIHPEPNTDVPKKRHRKAAIEQDKTGDLDAFGPQKVSDYERLLLGQPNSSALWIQYMAFQLGLNEVEEARKIADRALKTINMTEEEEKINVWTALLNLETTYGSEETLDTVFERACQMSDKKLVHMRLASILIDSGKHKVWTTFPQMWR
jgi:rRNA biogenesis protein RRP5